MWELSSYTAGDDNISFFSALYFVPYSLRAVANIALTFKRTLREQTNIIQTFN